MGRTAIIAAICAGALAAGASPAAAYCVGRDPGLPGWRGDYYGVAQEYRRAHYVLVGHVVRETWLGDDGRPKPLRAPRLDDGLGGFDPYMGALYDLTLVKGLKGVSPAKFQVWSANSVRRVRLKPGRDYLLFLTLAREPLLGPVLVVDPCGHSGPMPQAAGLARQAEALAKAPPRRPRREAWVEPE